MFAIFHNAFGAEQTMRDHAKRSGKPFEARLARFTCQGGCVVEPPALSKPFLWIEYAHAMGNGPGGMEIYDSLIDIAGGLTALLLIRRRHNRARRFN